MPLDFSCADWSEKLQAGNVPIADIPVDAEEAEAAVGLFNSLRVPDILNQPTFGEVGGEWFRNIIRPAFGAIDRTAGERLVGELFLLVPKKNAKTTGAGALGVVWICRNIVPNVEGLIIGPTHDVAETCFGQIKGMIEADGDLTKLFQIQEHKKKITHKLTKATLQVKTFDMKVVTGTIPAFCILDELHLLSLFSFASKVLVQIRGGMITNPMSLLIIITTQSTDPPAGVFKTELNYARGVRDGRITKNVRMLPVLYEFPEDVQRDETKPWLDQRLWPMVLPNLGLSVTLPRLQALYDAATEKGEEDLRQFASQHLNIQIGLALHSERWSGAEFWEGAADEVLDFKELKARCECIVGGFDGGGLDDLASLCLLGRCRETRNWLAWFHTWAHPDVLRRRKDIAETLESFQKDNDLTIVEDSDPLRVFREVTDILVEINDLGLFPESGAIGFDSQAVSDLTDMLVLEGFTYGESGQMVAVPQGWKLTAAIKGLELRLKVKTLRHGGRPILNWVIGNAKSEERGRNIYIEKKSASAKIDPFMALLNAYSQMAGNPKARGPGIGSFLANPVMVA